MNLLNLKKLFHSKEFNKQYFPSFSKNNVRDYDDLTENLDTRDGWWNNLDLFLDSLTQQDSDSLDESE